MFEFHDMFFKAESIDFISQIKPTGQKYGDAQFCSTIDVTGKTYQINSESKEMSETVRQEFLRKMKGKV